MARKWDAREICEQNDRKEAKETKGRAGKLRQWVGRLNGFRRKCLLIPKKMGWLDRDGSGGTDR